MSEVSSLSHTIIRTIHVYVKSMNQKRIINYSRAVKTQEAKMNQYDGKSFFFSFLVYGKSN